MNYHSDKYILDKVHEHLEESLEHFSEDVATRIKKEEEE